jgi:hypothetical protein
VVVRRLGTPGVAWPVQHGASPIKCNLELIIDQKVAMKAPASTESSAANSALPSLLGSFQVSEKSQVRLSDGTDFLFSRLLAARFM